MFSLPLQWLFWIPPLLLSLMLLTQSEMHSPILMLLSLLTLAATIASANRIARDQCRLVRYRQLSRRLTRSKRARERQDNRAQRILNHIVDPDGTAIAGTKVHQIPLYGFSGDLAIVCESEDGRIYTLLADLTGHGITAAMGATPVASIFKATAKRGMSIEAIAEELNNRLLTLLPSGFFCCAALLVVDRKQGTLEACNAGLPEMLVTRSDGSLAEVIDSTQLPFGIQQFDADDVQVTRRRYEGGHQIYAFTDGLIESPGPDPDLFSIKSLIETIKNLQYGDGRMAQIWSEHQRLTQEIPPDDDITIVEVAIC